MLSQLANMHWNGHRDKIQEFEKAWNDEAHASTESKFQLRGQGLLGFLMMGLASTC